MKVSVASLRAGDWAWKPPTKKRKKASGEKNKRKKGFILHEQTCITLCGNAKVLTLRVYPTVSGVRARYKGRLFRPRQGTVVQPNMVWVEAGVTVI